MQSELPSSRAMADDPRADQHYLSSSSILLHPRLQHNNAPVYSNLSANKSVQRKAAPSFLSFRSHLPATTTNTLAPQQDTRHQSRASFSRSEKASPRLADPTTRPVSIASPGLQQDQFQPPRTRTPNTIAPASATVQHRSPAKSSSEKPSHDRNVSIDSDIPSTLPSSTYSSPRRFNNPVPAKYAHDRKPSHAQQRVVSSEGGEQREQSDAQHSEPMSQPAPTMTVQQQDGIKRTLTDDSLYSEYADSHPKRPKSPAGSRGGLGSLFGWNTAAKSNESSPTTTFSERSTSPSPGLIKPPSLEGAGRARLTPPGLDVQKANVAGTYFHNPQTPLLLGDGPNNVHVRELERELSHVSSELAESIRREMELEDELDRMRMEFPTSESQRRSSDYFSDSGASSGRYPISDFDAKLEQVERQLRKVEQEKANLKVETASRLQTELSRRRDLEELVRDLEDQLEKRDEKEDRTPGDKVEELMVHLEEARRRLSQEKMTKENFEDLYSATREELERLRNEADNLRDEVVPQLKARVEGLEGQAGDTQGLIYENTRLQQELAALREAHSNHSRFSSIHEEGVASAIGRRMSLHRSGMPTRSSSLRRADSVKGRDSDRDRSPSVPPIPEAVKEVEEQRDALHKALKLLIRRHEKQNRDHERAITKLTVAKNRAEQVSPKRTAYTREVAFLKEEVTTLRKRTEDALEQKWQYEKSLSGLKMDLDRAEQETRGLRTILQESDLSSPTSTLSAEDEQLKLSITRAETERDHARAVAAEYRQRAVANTTEPGSGSSDDLLAAATRMDELAEQLEAQVQSHTQLRSRLTAAVVKGEEEQRESTRRIEEMQKRLKGMEDSVLAAQQHSETTLACHDAEVRRIEDASSPSLARLAVPSSPAVGARSPSPMLGGRSPRLGGKMETTSLLEMSRTVMLERKVRELEGLLREAEEDVKVVVMRVTRSQLEVAELQLERDGVVGEMRRLRGEVERERERWGAEILK
ncbi:unnamed protein product [Zymoseptoria tritici ST99CH_1A5]|uniref:DUF7603 domain-containing protein n=2 Tax=Zymoseptoria tritici TaxID=1047171 RepID=A0A2H1FPX5_ZYMTR|nr:unnamed protein product [Zymoseptoria tritici ST99CH_1E4]SMY20650.1 unnamed protein product [Zymoseptoria tritici ST99CH_1A5]